MKKLLFIPLLFTFYMGMAQTDSASIIGKSIRVGNLVVAEYDFPNAMNWDDAKKACAELGKGWRLPTQAEWGTLYKERNDIGGFTGNKYWSSTELGAYNAWVQNFLLHYRSEYGLSKSVSREVDVRAVRTFK